MKKFIQSLFALLVVLVLMLVLAVPSQAQQYNTTANTLTAGYAVSATTTVNSAAMTMTKNAEVVITCAGKLTAAGTGASEFTFKLSKDGTTYDSAETIVIPLTQAGTVSASVSTNVTLGAYGYIRLNTLSNVDADGVLTNVVVSYTVKPTRQDGK
jgi:hypothetical protein